jgi:hypothetical protein
MNVLIVGDSFAASNSEIGWVNLLRSKVNSVKCVAEGATSLFYSYKKLLEENLKSYDYVIVLVTYYGRLTFPDKPHMNSYFTAEIYKDNPDQKIKDRAQAAMQYYQHLDNEEVNRFLHLSLLTEIRQLLKDVPHILQPGFPNSLIARKHPVKFCLTDITDKQIESISKELYPRIFNPNERLINHMSYSNNKILSDYFFDMMIKGSSEITIRDFNRLEEPIEQWFTE